MSRLREFLNSSQLVLGTWSQSSSPEMLEIIGYSGFNFTIIDTEHGYYGLETAENLVRTAEAAGISPFVRVAVNEPHLIMKALDIGAEGVVVPQVTTREEAQKAISAARYYPEGTRGACPCIRTGKHYITEWSQYATKANKDVVVMVIIEGKTGMENMNEIIETPGLDAVIIGPFDMSVALGVGGQLDHPLVIDFMKKVIQKCKEQNVTVCIPNFDLDYERAKDSINKWTELGCNIFTVGTDKIFFAHYMKKVSDYIKGV